MPRSSLLPRTIALGFFLFGCAHPTSHTTERAPSATEDKATRECVRAIKTRIAKNQLNFLDVRDPESETAVREARKPFPSGSDTLWVARSPKERLVWTKFAKNRSAKLRDGTRTTSFGVSLSEEQAFSVHVSLVATRVSYDRAGAHRTDLTESLEFDGDCRERLGQAELSIMDFAGGTVNLTEKTLFPGPGHESVHVKKATFNVPAGSRFVLEDLAVEGPSLAKFLREVSRKKLVVAAGVDAGLLELRIEPTSYVDALSGSLQPIDGFQATIFIEDSPVSKAFHLESADHQQKLFGDELNISRNVLPAFWLDAGLAPKEKDAAMAVEVAPGAHVEEDYLDLVLESREPFSTANLSPYWKSEAVVPTSPGAKVAYHLRSQPQINYSVPSAPPVSDPGTDRYLSESLYVDLSDPSVQAHVAKLRSRLRPGMTRLEIVMMIAKYMPTVLQYDHRMISDGDYQFNMKTSDILARGSAVCQQFVNVFVAFARSLGVPARSVGGILLFGAGSGAMHAWNEFEIAPHVWLPIEPQNPVLIFNPSHYIPLFIEHYERQPYREPMPFRFLHDNVFSVRVLRSNSDQPFE